MARILGHIAFKTPTFSVGIKIVLPFILPTPPPTPLQPIFSTTRTILKLPLLSHPYPLVPTFRESINYSIHQTSRNEPERFLPLILCRLDFIKSASFPGICLISRGCYFHPELWRELAAKSTAGGAIYWDRVEGVLDSLRNFVLFGRSGI